MGGGIDNGAGGIATLEDTIVAANSGTGGSPNDIGGANAVGVVGIYDLVGSGGSGGVAGGTGDIVLTNIGPLLAPLGYYGGPTQTMPLLPGSPAVGTGTAINGITTTSAALRLARTPRLGPSRISPAWWSTPRPTALSSPPGDLSLRQAVDLATCCSATPRRSPSIRPSSLHGRRSR